MRRFALKFWAYLDKNKLMKTRIAHIILLLSIALFVGPVYGSTNGVPSDSQISAVSDEPYAASDPILYKVTIDNGSISKEYLVEAGETITFSVGTPSDDCLEFVKWSDGITDKYRSVQVHGNFTIFAIFEIKQFTITVDTSDPSKGTVGIEKL